jgi:hypothetical protein
MRTGRTGQEPRVFAAFPFFFMTLIRSTVACTDYHQARTTSSGCLPRSWFVEVNVPFMFPGPDEAGRRDP